MNSLRRRDPTVHCNNPYDAVDLPEKLQLSRKLRPELQLHPADYQVTFLRGPSDH